MRYALVFACFCLVLAGVIPQGHAQSARDLTNRLNRLEKEIDTLNRAVYKGGALPPPATFNSDDPAAAADAQVRLQQLEIELRDIRGLMEEQGNEIRQLKTQLERALSDIELRLGDAGSAPAHTGSSAPYTASSAGTGAAPTATPPRTGSGNFEWSSNGGAQNSGTHSGTLGTINPTPDVSASAKAVDGPAAQYENAFSLIRNGRYNAAEAAFKDFIAQNPDHALISNAKYWLGETYYVRGDFETSARVFAEGYKQFPKASKAPDNLLKLGLSLAGMGKTDDACVALKQLKKQYATGSQPVIRRADQELSGLGCV